LFALVKGAAAAGALSVGSPPRRSTTIVVVDDQPRVFDAADSAYAVPDVVVVQSLSLGIGLPGS
jgi:hypothetical protein